MIVAYHDIFKRKYHDIFDILIFSKYQPLLLLFTYLLIHAYLTQKAIDGVKTLPKILTLCVGRNNVVDDRHRRTAHAIRRT